MFGFKFNNKSMPYMEKDKTIYAPLREGRSPSSDDSDHEDKTMSYSTPSGRSPRFWKISVLALLIVTNISTLAGLVAVNHLTKEVKDHEALESEYAPKSWGKTNSMT